MTDAASPAAETTAKPKEIVRTEALTDKEKALWGQYMTARREVQEWIRQSNQLAAQIRIADSALPRALDDLANTIAVRLGSSSYQEMKEQGLDLSIGIKDGTVSIVRPAPVTP